MQTASLQSVPIKVCVHEKARAERESAERREQQIQAICVEYQNLEERYCAQEQLLRNQQAEWRAQAEVLQGEIAALREQNMQQCLRLSELTSANAQIHQQFAEEKARFTQLESKHELQMQTVKAAEDREFVAKEYRKKYNETEHAYRALQKEHQLLQEQLETCKGDLEKQFTHNRQLLRSHNMAHSQLEKKEKAIAKSEAERKSANMETDALIHKIGTLTQTLEYQDRQLGQCQRRLEEGEAEADRLQRERARLRRELAECQETLRVQQQRSVDHAALLQEAQHEIQRLQAARVCPASPTPNPGADGAPRLVMMSHCPSCGGTGLDLKTAAPGVRARHVR
jgi:DNA repair exonuclease SbcCD ATPase subunit